MSVSKFYKGRSTFNCRMCRRLTRDSSGCGQTEMCSFCDEWTQEENGISDNNLQGEERAAALARIETLKNKARAKGGILE